MFLKVADTDSCLEKSRILRVIGQDEGLEEAKSVCPVRQAFDFLAIQTVFR